ncbi:tyrosine-type recombinase/integrase [Rhodanobacter umsongensis]
MRAKKLLKRFTPAIIEAAKPEDVAYRMWDVVVPQLHLRVLPTGIKVWYVRWKTDTNKVLGKWPGVTIESARMKAKAVLVETDVHGAPLDVIEANKPPEAKALTFGEYIRDHYAPWAVAHQKAGQATVDALAATFGTIYEKPLDEIKAIDVEGIKAKRLKAGRMPATVNRDLDRIRGALSRAVDWGMLTEHPLRTVKRAKGVDNSRVRYLTKPEEKRLREALQKREDERRKHRVSGNTWCAERGGDGRPMWPATGYTDHLMPLVLVALNTGLRRGELFSLDWGNVNLPGKMLTVTVGNAKSRKARHIPLNTEALAVLKRWKKQHGGEGLVYPGASGERLGNINKSWDGLVTAAKLPDFRFHDLRHDFASKLVMAGVDLNTVRELLGHADIAMTLRYSHLAPAKLAAAVAMLGGAK